MLILKKEEERQKYFFHLHKTVGRLVEDAYTEVYSLIVGLTVVQAFNNSQK